MCRNIKTLFNFDPPATDDEIRAAALQFVRKLSGFNVPNSAISECIGAPALTGNSKLFSANMRCPLIRHQKLHELNGCSRIGRIFGQRDA